MNEMMKTMAASASGMMAQSARIRLGAENIANVDTPGYHRKTVSFETEFAAAGDARAVRTGPVRLGQGALALAESHQRAHHAPLVGRVDLPGRRTVAPHEEVAPVLREGGAQRVRR